ncbi:MAG TPA: hypothetical protein VLG46_06535 [Anaerolineae bacterium]|nr:hypothetical protein [Anaerolineae bacterium]
MSRYSISRIALIFVLFLSSLFIAAPTLAGWHSLTGLLPDYTHIEDYQISPDSHRVVFLADVDVAGREELYSVPITGSVPIQLNPPLVGQGRVRRFGITPDSSRVIYIDKLNGYAHDVQSIQIFGGGRRNLSHVGSEDSAGSLQISSDGKWIVFEVYHAGRYELRVSDGAEGFYTYLPVVLK